jgi:two-component system chemotaxis sensor kinase CheA
MDELLSEFLTECFESMTQLDRELLQLERTPDDPDLIASIFRLVHTIKGTCGFLDLSRLERVAHAAENVLGKLRDRKLAATPAIITLILEALDRIGDILNGLASQQVEPAGDDGALIAALDAVADDGAVTDENHAACDGPPPVAAAQADASPDFHEDVSLPAGLAPSPAGTIDGGARPDEASRGGGAAAPATQTLRVPVDLLEQLMTLVGELVLTRNQLVQRVRQASDPSLKAPLQRLSQITGELQEGVMRTRMQAVGTAWGKLPRLIRDLGLELGKEIELEMQGAETELDRHVLEMIRDPLTHMVRNAADHGIERPADRIRVGKPARGTIRLNAFHEGGHIIIEIGDDGKGLDTRRIADKAVARGLADEADVAAMAEREIQQFVFHPGLSTAETVTAVSGRGVGMDVVRTNIEQIGGSIDIRSTTGRGSVFTIKIPLTLAIVSALIVEAGGERFALPHIGVVELVPTGKHSEHRVERLDGVRVLRLHDRLLPLVSLAELLGLTGNPLERSVDGSHVVLARVGSRVFGLEVDRLFDAEEIVVKRMPPILRSISAFSGNTILGDGSVVMILDLNGIAAMIDSSHDEAERRPATKERDAADERVPLLLFEAADGSGWHCLWHSSPALRKSTVDRSRTRVAAASSIIATR